MTTPNTDWLVEAFYNCLPTYAVEQQHLDQLKQAILQHEQQAVIYELERMQRRMGDCYDGHNDLFNNRIATLTQQTSQGVSDE